MEKPLVIGQLPTQLQVPTPRVPYVNLPRITTPSVPVPGTLDYYYKQLEAEEKKRASLFFDINNHNEVNSWADVVVGTASGLFEGVRNGDFEKIMDTVGKTVADSFNVINRGTIQPIINGDMGALANNTLVNFSETVDVLDNLWKGFAIPMIQDGGTLEDSIEGFKGAFFDRENYEWDTGNKFLDFAGELLTPTNLLLLGGSTAVKAGAKGVAKGAGLTVAGKKAVLQGAKELGEDVGTTISKKALRTFTRDYADDATRSLTELAKKYGISEAAASTLQDVAIHSTTMKVLGKTRKVLDMVDAVDSFGPKMAFAHTFLPLKLAWRGGKATINMLHKYAADVYTRSIQSTNLVQFVAEQGQLIKDLTALELAAKVNNEELVTMPLEDIISDKALKDFKVFQEVYRKHYRQIAAESIDGMPNATTSAYTMLQDLNRAIEAGIRQVSEGVDTVNSLDDYLGVIERLRATTRPNRGLDMLYSELMNMKQVVDMLNAKESVDKLALVRRWVDRNLATRRRYMLGDIEGKAARAEIKFRHYTRVLDETYGMNFVEARQFILNKPPAEDMYKREVRRQVERLFRNIQDVQAEALQLEELKIKLISGQTPDGMSMITPFEATKTLEDLRTFHMNLLDKGIPYNRDAYFEAYADLTDYLRKYINREIKIEDAVDIRTKLDHIQDLLAPEALLQSDSEVFEKVIMGRLIPLKSIKETMDSLLNMTYNKKESSPVRIRKKPVEQRIIDVLNEDIKPLKTSIEDLRKSLDDPEVWELLADRPILSTLEDLDKLLEGVFKEEKMVLTKETVNAIREVTNSIRNTLIHYKDQGVNLRLSRQTSTRTTEVLYDGRYVTEAYMHSHALGILKQYKLTYEELQEFFRVHQAKNPTHKAKKALNDLIHSKSFTSVERKAITKDKGVSHYSKLEKAFDALSHVFDTTDMGKAASSMNVEDMPLYKAIDDIQNLLLPEAYNVINVDEPLKEYMFQTSKLVKSMQIMGLDSLDEILELMDLHQAGDEGINIIRGISVLEYGNPERDAIIGMARNIITTLEGLQSLKKFYAAVGRATESGEITEDVGVRFLDAVQSFYNRPATLTGIDGAPESYWVEAILDNVAQQMENISKPFNTKLENIAEMFEDLASDKKLPEEIQKLYEARSSKSSHFAQSDVYITYLMDRYMGMNHKGVRMIYRDIETTSLNSRNGVILQDAMFDPQTGLTHVFVNRNAGDADAAIGDSLYDVLYKDVGGKAAYDAIHKGGSPEYIKSIFGEPNTIVYVCEDEADLIRQTDLLTKGIADSGAPIKYGMWNGEDFDRGYINFHIAKYKDVYKDWELRFISPNAVHDGMVEWKKRNGIRILSETEREKLTELLQSYLSLRRVEMTYFSRDLRNIIETADATHEGKFIPSVDAKFRDNLEQLLNYMDGTDSLSEVNDDLAKVAQGLQHAGIENTAFSKLRRLRQDIGDALRGIKQTDEMLNGFVTDKEIMKNFVDERFFERVPHKAMRSDENITAMLNQFYKEQKIKSGTVNVKILRDDSTVADWFKVNDMALSDYEQKKFLDMAKNMRRFAEGVDMLHMLDDHRETIPKLIPEVQRFIQETVGNHYFRGITQYLRVDGGLLQNFTVLHELFMEAHKIVDTQKLHNSVAYKKLLEKFPSDLQYMLRTPSVLKWHPDKPKDLFHALDYINDDFRSVMEYILPDAGKQIDTVEEYIAHGNDTVQTAKLKRMAAVYRPVLEVFNASTKLAETITDPEDVIRFYNELRISFEHYSEQLAYKKIYDVLHMDPQTLRRYLWQYAQGYVVTTKNALNSASYFKTRNNIASKDIINSDELFYRFDEMLKNKSAYAELGIDIKMYGDEIVIALDLDKVPVKELNALEPLRLSDDYNIAEVFVSKDMQEIVDKWEVDALLNKVKQARRELLDLTSDGHTSTLEKMDYTIYQNILKRNYRLSSHMPEPDLLLRFNRFDGSMFNHSVLGDIDSRRVFLPGSAFNPMKRMYNAMKMAHSKIATQDQFTAIALDPTSNVNTFIKSHQDKVDLVEYMKEHYKETRLVFMAEHPKKGYTLKTIYIDSVKDVDFAMSVNAVPMDINTFNKAYQMINRNKVPEGFIKWLDKLLVVPYKLGWLSLNPAMIMRNIVDSGLKNIITTGDLSMVPRMFAMTKDYVRYKRTSQQIVEYARYSGKSLHYAQKDLFEGLAAIDGKVLEPALDQYNYNLISRFKIDGASSGMVSELKRELGDAVDKVYRRLGREQGTLLNETMFREIMSAPEDVSEALLKKLFSDPAKYTFILDERRKLHYYKRGYEMLKYYKKPDITIDRIVTYLQRPDRIPPEHREAMEMMLHKTRNFSMNESLYDKVMTNPLFSASMELNGATEEIMRLSLFKHVLEEQHGTYSEAMAAVNKTHFDYAHKSQLQMYLEMVMPFSTFRMNNMIYWMEAFGKNHQLIELVNDYATSIVGTHDYTPEERKWYMGLNYHLDAGNIRFDNGFIEKYGLDGVFNVNNNQEIALKINPSFMDTLQFVSNPVGYLEDAWHSGGQTLVDLMNLEPYNNETADEYNARRKKMYMQLVPLIGPSINRLQSKFNDNPMMNIILSPFFSGVSMPREWNNNRRRMYPSRNYQRARSYRAPRITRPNRIYYSTYSTFNRWYYGTPVQYRNGVPYMTQTSRNWNRVFSDIHGRSVSRSGRPKYRFLAFPTNKWTLPIKIGLLRNISNHVRYSY